MKKAKDEKADDEKGNRQPGGLAGTASDKLLYSCNVRIFSGVLYQ